MLPKVSWLLTLLNLIYTFQAVGVKCAFSFAKNTLWPAGCKASTCLQMMWFCLLYQLWHTVRPFEAELEAASPHHDFYFSFYLLIFSSLWPSDLHPPLSSHLFFPPLPPFHLILFILFFHLTYPHQLFLALTFTLSLLSLYISSSPISLLPKSCFCFSHLLAPLASPLSSHLLSTFLSLSHFTSS